MEALRMWNVSALPVLSGDGRVSGVVSEADLLERGTGAAGVTTAEQLMTRPAVTVTVTKDATIPAAARLLAHSHLKRLPVVDGDGRLTGIGSRGDLLKVYLRADADIAAGIRELARRRRGHRCEERARVPRWRVRGPAQLSAARFGLARGSVGCGAGGA
ncbi:CBS domain-containing protein [Streptomyces goshikiensis]|uniref:CBS domain-containing protein n=1 Tax=Streptomyces goshikiensis TaxID=1942 RepID=UPI0036AD84B9